MLWQANRHAEENNKIAWTPIYLLIECAATCLRLKGDYNAALKYMTSIFGSEKNLPMRSG
jgi:hypothetical protein